MSDVQTTVEAALARALEKPLANESWVEAENAAAELDAPEQVANAYREAIATLSANDAEVLGERAARFHDEWFGPESSEVEMLLRGILERSQNCEWAFQKLSANLTMAEKWESLLDLYDSAIAASTDDAQKTSLLDEAFQTARDLAQNKEKASQYLTTLCASDPNSKRRSELEGLLTEQEKWNELIGLWSQGNDANKAPNQLKIATTYSQKLSNHSSATDILETLLSGEKADEAKTLLEEISGTENLGPLRERVVATLRHHYQNSGDSESDERLLRQQVVGATSEEISSVYRRELASLYTKNKNYEQAFDELTQLLLANPDESETLSTLESLAANNGFETKLAEVLFNVAQNTEGSTKNNLLDKVATLKRGSDDASAIEIWTGLLEQDLDAEQSISIGRKLETTLASLERHDERLKVLELLLSVATDPAVRHDLTNQLADAAEDCGQPERAVEAWKVRLENNPDDAKTLENLINLLEREENWSDLVQYLEQRSDLADNAQGRSDLISVARIYETNLNDEANATASWLHVRGRFGACAETSEALGRLLANQGRWEELAEVLEEAVAEDTERLASQLSTLGTAYKQELSDDEKALQALSRCLRITPQNDEARASLLTLVDNPQTKKEALVELSRAYEASRDWVSVFSLVEKRVEIASSDEELVTILTEGANIASTKLDDNKKALELFCRALPLAGRAPGIENEIQNLAQNLDENQDSWEMICESYSKAATQAENRGSTNDCVRLERELGKMYRDKCNDSEKALLSFSKATSLDATNRDSILETVTLACQQNAWSTASQALCSFIREQGSLDEDLLESFIANAESHHQIDNAIEAIGETIRRFDLSKSSHAEMSYQIASWHLDKRQDEKSSAVWLQEVIRTNPSHLAATETLVDILRKDPNDKLLGGLRGLSEIRPRDISLRLEAAQVAVQYGDENSKRNSLRGFLSEFRRSPKADLVEEVSWAVETLVATLCDAGEHRDALSVLQESAELSIGDEGQQNLRLQAAEIADSTGDTASAIEIFRSILVRNPANTDAMSRLQYLLSGQGRYSELLAAKRVELRQNPGPARRLALRLEIVDTVQKIESENPPLQTLQENLEEAPGHEATLRLLITRLENEGRHFEVVEALRSQAELVTELGEDAQAAMLWQWTGRIAEGRAQMPEVALESYRRSVGLVEDASTLDSIARIYREANRGAEALPWLEQRLAITEDQDKPEVWLSIACAQMDGKRYRAAAETLRDVVQNTPSSYEARTMLSKAFTELDDKAGLANHLSDSLSYLESEETAVAWASQAAELYHQEGQPELAIPALEKATAHDSKNIALNQMLANSYKSAGRTEESRTLLETLISTFGRRRTKERALLHVDLSDVYRQEGDTNKAYEELETASRMDVENASISLALANAAAASGNVSQAEKTLRGLLITLRRNESNSESGVGESNVIFQLWKIANDKGDESQAGELCEQMLDAAATSNHELVRLCADLQESQELELALQATQKRLDKLKGGDASNMGVVHRTRGQIFGQIDNRQSEALNEYVAAVGYDSGDLESADKARFLAESTDQIASFVDQFEKFTNGWEQDAPGLGEHLMMLGELTETTLGDTDRANRFYGRAEELGTHQTKALFAKAKNVETDEERNECFDAIDKIVPELDSVSEKADLQYRLADLQLNCGQFVERGLDTLRQAISFEPRYRQAGLLLRNIEVSSELQEEVLSLYERVARAAHDSDLLLDYLEKRANSTTATPKQVREAVEYSAELGQPGRGIALLEQTVSHARTSEGGLADAAWAATALIRSRIAVGEVASACDLFQELSEFGAPETVRTLGFELAEVAGSSPGSLEIAAISYEKLLEQTPLDRSVWEPLTSVYESLEATAKLQSLVENTVPLLTDVDERNRLRLTCARTLLLADDSSSAESLLRDALLDNPDDNDAAVELEILFTQSANEEALAEFLVERFEDAKNRGQAETAALTAIRIGALWQETGRGNPLDIYQQALDVAPENPDLLRLTIESWPEDGSIREKALLELSLLRVEDIENCETLAMDLLAIWESLEDGANSVKTLELGVSRLPESELLRSKLEEHYRAEEAWQPLAEFLLDLASSQKPEVAATMYADASRIYRKELSNSDRAVEILSDARTQFPTELVLVTALAESHAATGNRAAAVSCISAALEGEVSGADRVPLLEKRSSLRFEIGESEAAVNDLEGSVLS